MPEPGATGVERRSGVGLVVGEADFTTHASVAGAGFVKVVEVEVEVEVEMVVVDETGRTASSPP
jgi:hypothetical protein